MPCSSRRGSIREIEKLPLRSSGSACCSAVWRSLCNANFGGVRTRASTRYVCRFPSFERSCTWPAAAGPADSGWSRNQCRGVSSTNTRMRITAMSYCHVVRSYDQKNVFERICPRLAISVRGHAIDDDAVAHMHHAIKVSGGFRIVRDHHDGLAKLFVQLAKHLEHGFGVFGVEVPRRFIGQKDLWFVDDRACDGNTLLLASREFGWFVLKAARQAEHLGNHVEAVRIETVAVNKLRDSDIAFCGERRKQVEALKDETDLAATELGARGIGQSRKVIAVNEDLAARRLREPADYIEERRLAAS